jgi:hypothetical protein
MIEPGDAAKASLPPEATAAPWLDRQAADPISSEELDQVLRDVARATALIAAAHQLTRTARDQLVGLSQSEAQGDRFRDHLISALVHADHTLDRANQASGLAGQMAAELGLGTGQMGDLARSYEEAVDELPAWCRPQARQEDEDG